MSIHPHDERALRISITERLAAARAQVASLHPADQELRRRLRQQLDAMLAELCGPGDRAEPAGENAPGWSAEPPSRPALSLQQTRKI
jgi:hypothetical protein